MNKVSFTLLNIAAAALLAFAIYLNFFYKEKVIDYRPSHGQQTPTTATDSLSLSQSTSNSK